MNAYLTFCNGKSVLIILCFITFILQAIYLMTDYKPTEDEEMPVVRTKEIFNRMDTNGDGVLSKDEFIRGCLGDERLFKLLAYSSGGGGTDAEMSQTPDSE